MGFMTSNTRTNSRNDILPQKHYSLNSKSPTEIKSNAAFNHQMEGYQYLIQNKSSYNKTGITSQNQSQMTHFAEKKGNLQTTLSKLDSNPQFIPGNTGSFFKMDMSKIAPQTTKHAFVAKSARNFSASRNSAANMFQKTGQMMLPISDSGQAALTKSIKNPLANLRTSSRESKQKHFPLNLEPKRQLAHFLEGHLSMQATGNNIQNTSSSLPRDHSLGQQQRTNAHQNILQAPTKKLQKISFQGVSGTAVNTQNEKIQMINNSAGTFKSASQGQQITYNFQNGHPNTNYKQANRNGSMSSNGNINGQNQTRQQLTNLNQNFNNNGISNMPSSINNQNASNHMMNGQLTNGGNSVERKPNQQGSNSMPPRSNANMLNNNQIGPNHLLLSNANIGLKTGGASNQQVSQPAFINQANALQLQNQNAINTLLQNRKDGQGPVQKNILSKVPSGKDLMNQQKLNFTNSNTISKSVEKAQPSQQVNQNGNQFINLNSKDGKNTSLVQNTGFKEKRLSQSQAQHFVNSQFASSQQNQTLLSNNAQNPVTQPAPIPQTLNGGTQIIIHVCDENKKMNKDFKCDKNLLISNMKYFEKYLSDSKTLDDIDISVHCDINIFDWLMRYIHRKEPVIEIKNSVSILISSDFLQMATLVEEALSYVAKYLNEIIQLPIDMNCMNSVLIKRLAAKVSLNDLNELQDKKDKLTSKLYMKKLECLFEEEHNMLHRCVNCSSLYTSNQREWNQCPKANIFIDFNGNVVAKHQSDKYWDINKFVMYLRQKQLAWQDIFWKMFARLQEFRCTNCDLKFIGAEINHCSSHPNPPKFLYQAIEGVHPCCDSKATRFSCGLKGQGCSAKNHKIKTGSPRKTVKSRAQNFELIMDHFKIACEPYQYQVEDPRTGVIQNKVQQLDMIDEDKALLHLVNQFIKQSPKHIAEQEAKAAREAKREARQKAQELLLEKQLIKNAAAQEDGPLQAETDQNQMNNNQEHPLIESDSWEDLPTISGKDKEDFDLNDELFYQQDQSCFNIFKVKSKKGRKYREWKTDVIRNDDESQMEFLEKQLQRMRKKEEYPVSRKQQPKKNATPIQGAAVDQNNQQSASQCRPSTSGNVNALAQGYVTQGVMASNSMGMNIRNRVKQQQQQQRMKPNGKYIANIRR